MHFLSSIQVHLLKGRRNALSDYERESCAKKRDQFSVSNVELTFKISQRFKKFAP